MLLGPFSIIFMKETGTNNFARLPVLTETIEDVKALDADDPDISFENNISILCFLGNQPLAHKTNALNLNEKIYKHFYGFKGFQFIVVLPESAREEAAQLKKELGATYNVEQWHFLFMQPERVQQVFSSLETNYKLDPTGYSPYAFIIDRDMKLRGRNDDDEVEGGFRYGYNAESISTVHQEMVDDVKVVVAEDRLALKKNKREI